MKTITLCGSTKYKEEFINVNKWLTLQGNVVISCSIYGQTDGDPITEEDKIILDKVHFAKIDLSDEIFVINVNNYIGSSTRNEINYADSKGKKIRYFTDEKEEFDKWLKSYFEKMLN